MNASVLDLANRLAAAGNRDHAWQAAIDFFRAHGFDNGVFGRVSSANPVLDDLLTTVPIDFWRTWCREGWDRTDFAVIHAKTTSKARFEYIGTPDTNAMPPQVVRMVNEMGAHAARAVFLTPEPRIAEDLPTGRVGLLSLGSSMSQAAFEAMAREVGDLLVVASHLTMARLAQLPGGMAIDTEGTIVRDTRRAPRVRSAAGVVLSPRERECLLWLARGLRNERIAETLGIAPSTVEMHISRARRKLQARTREQAVATAVLLGLIEP